MAGGHCYGFSVLAELLWQRKLNVTTLGAPATTALDIDNNQALQRLIAYDWALQTLDSVQSKRITGTPNQILAKLRKVLRPNPSETYTIAFWKRDGTGGHAVTPYAVENKGGGKFDVLIYDNNWPGQTRAISFDTKANTWTYDAAVNPNDRRRASTRGTPRPRPSRCSPPRPGSAPNPARSAPRCRATVHVVRGRGGQHRGDLSPRQRHQPRQPHRHRRRRAPARLHQRDAGQRDPRRPRRAVDLQPGLDEQHRARLLRAGRRQVHDHHRRDALTGADTETVGIIGPSYDLSVKDIPMNPGDKDTLVVEPDATKLSYTSSRPESPTLELGVSDNQADYSFDIGGVSDQPGSTINLEPAGRGWQPDHAERRARPGRRA